MNKGFGDPLPDRYTWYISLVMAVESKSYMFKQTFGIQMESKFLLNKFLIPRSKNEWQDFFLVQAA